MDSILHAQFSSVASHVSKRERWQRPELENKERRVKGALTRLCRYRLQDQEEEKPQVNYQVIVEAIH